MDASATGPGPRWRRALGAVVWAGLILAVQYGMTARRHARTGEAPPDEMYWVGSTYYFDLLRRGEIHHPDWQLLPALENPPVGKYHFGLALMGRGYRVESLDVLGFWLVPYVALGHGVAPEDYPKRLAVLRRLSPEGYDLAIRRSYNALTRADRIRLAEVARQSKPARSLAFALGFLTALAVWDIGRRVGGPWTGRIAGLGFVLHPVAVSAYSYVMVDVIALAFSVLAVALLLRLVEGSWGTETAGAGRMVAVAILQGLAIGLAVGSKMNALVVALLAGAAWIGLALRAARRREARGVRLAGLQGATLLIAAAVFVGVNPTLYPGVISGVRALFVEPARNTAIQAGLLPNHAATLHEKIRTLADLLTGGPAGLTLLLAVAVGLTILAAMRPGPRRVVVLWWWIALAAVGAWIPFPWERYALPLVPPAAVMVADALVLAARSISGASRPGR